MQSRSDTPHRNAALLAFAAGRHNVVDRTELRALGLDDAAVSRRVAAGTLRRLYPGVFGVGPVLTPEGRYVAAVRACGTGAVLSHRDAAALWDLHRHSSARFEVTVPFPSGVRTTRRIRVHRTRRPIETTTRHAIPVTTVARTLADLAEVVPRRALEKALEQAERLALLDVRAVDAIARAHPGRRGPALLRRLVHRHDTQSTTRSELEDAFLELCDRHAIPRPAVNARVEGMEVDCVWPAARLVIELDSWAWHATRGAFRRDRTKSRQLTLLGWTVVRITDDEMEEDPAGVAAAVRALLAQGLAAAA
jgi:predicted transcriptional regulator of viral defense system